jgi:plastocyanin
LRRAGLGCLLIALALQASPSRADTAVVEVVDGNDQPVADAAVFLMPSGGAAVGESSDPPGASAIMDQIGYQFVPRVLIVRTGTEVAFPNSDNVLHHVYSFSEAKRFELPLYAGTSHAPVLFERPGLVTLGCNIHDDMVGYILVVDTPYFGKTNESGRLELHDVPPGTYDVSAWSSRQRDTGTILHESFVLDANRGKAPLTLALAGQMRSPPPERHAGALWQAY